MKRALRRPSLAPVFFLGATFVLAACNSEVLEKQAEQIKQQEAEIARQRKEIDELAAGQKIEAQKRSDCNRAFRDYFEKAQAAADREKGIALYRDGLGLCPDDEVAHYELGKLLADRARYTEAEAEFRTALKINPDFVDAKKQLEDIRKKQ
jgi:tetratricopeptide (TPR) repeat protein